MRKRKYGLGDGGRLWLKGCGANEMRYFVVRLCRDLRANRIVSLTLNIDCADADFAEILEAMLSCGTLRELVFDGYPERTPTVTVALVRFFEQNACLTSFSCNWTLDKDVCNALGRTNMPLRKLGLCFSTVLVTTILPRVERTLTWLYIYDCDKADDEAPVMFANWLRKNRSLKVLDTVESLLSHHFHEVVVDACDDNNTLERIVCLDMHLSSMPVIPASNRTLFIVGPHLFPDNFKRVEKRKRNMEAAVVALLGLQRRAGPHCVGDSKPVLQLIARMVAATRNNPVWERDL